MEVKEVVGTCVLFFLMILLAFCLGAAFGDLTSPRGDWVRREAIREGVAERIITNPVTGETEFKWKECECK